MRGLIRRRPDPESGRCALREARCASRARLRLVAVLACGLLLVCLLAPVT